MVTLTVGPDGASNGFQLYRGLLCHYSDYFDRMLNGLFKEGGSQSLRLKDITVEVFQTFYYWLNSGVVDCAGDSTSPSLSTTQLWKKIIEVYIFADFHQARAFQNAILDHLYFANEDTRKLAMHITPASSPPSGPWNHSFHLLRCQDALTEGGISMPGKCICCGNLESSYAHCIAIADSPLTMATPEKKEEVKKVYAQVELTKCTHATEPPSPDEYGEIVTIVVGTEETGKESFSIYEGLLKHYSTYFKAALKKEWIGAAEKVIELPLEIPETFRAFYHFVYTQKLFSRLTAEGKIPLSSDKICRIYVFGDSRGIPELCNAAVDLLFQRDCQTWQYSAHTLTYIYGETSEHSLLRKYMVDYAVQKYSLPDIKIKPSKYPKEFLIDYIEKLSSEDGKMGSLKTMSTEKYIHLRKLEICSKYHDHSASQA